MGAKHRAAATWLAATGLALLLAALLLAAACAVNPVTGQEELVLMSEAQELALGARYYPQTTQINYGLPAADPGLQRYVERVGRRLAAVSQRPQIPWQFNAVNSSQVNAFALPGGKISITRGLITKMHSEDELASVLGHEIGHVTARHTVAQYTRQVLISTAVLGLGLALSGSDYQQLALLSAGVAGTLLMLGYSRDQERQADQLGYDYMVSRGYNPRGQVLVFKTFQKLDKREPSFIEAMLSSHPLTRERVETARRRVAHSDPRLLRRPLKVKPFQTALARQLDRRPAYRAMDQGDKQMARKRFDQAAARYRKAIRLFGGEGVFHSKLATARFQAGKFRRALGPARRGARLGPQVFFCQFVAGLAYWRTRQFNKALPYFQKADKLLPGYARNKLFLAACYESLGRTRQAVYYYRQVVAMAPQTSEAQAAQGRLRHLGYY